MPLLEGSMAMMTLAKTRAVRAPGLGGSSGSARTPFPLDVSTAIDCGNNDVATVGFFNNPSNAGEDPGPAMFALLEMRAHATNRG